MTDPSSYCKAAPDDIDPEGSPPHDPQVMRRFLETDDDGRDNFAWVRVCRWCGRVWGEVPS